MDFMNGMATAMTILILIGFIIIVGLSALIWLTENISNTNKKILSELQKKNNRDGRLDTLKNPVVRHRGGTGDH